MRYVTFPPISIQKGRRIMLNATLLKNLSIQEGDMIQVTLDTKEHVIMIKKSAISSNNTAFTDNKRYGE